MSRARKRAKTAPTHIVTLTLQPSPAVRSTVDTRFEGGRRVFNACLGEAFDRARRMRVDPAYQQARQLPPGPERSAGFRRLREQHGFTRSSLLTYASSLRTGWVRQHVFAQEAQVLGGRAFDAVNRWVLGQGGRPRFKNPSRGLHSLQGKETRGALRPVLDNDGSLAGVQWGRGLLIPARATPQGGARRIARRIYEQQVVEHIQAGRVVHTRIVRQQINSRWVYRAQLVIDAPAPLRHPTSEGLVGLDIGPSTVAVVTDTTVALERFCNELRGNQGEVRRLQRRLDRQHRAGSPECFDEQGRHKPGRCAWWSRRSKRARWTAAALADAHRKLAAHRQSLHGNLVNRILGHGVTVNTEKLSYIAFQRSFSRSVRDRAPGEFIRLLRRKADSAGGHLLEFSTRTTALSQRCVCGRRERKPLSQRQHACPECGFAAQRDVLSAFLARHVRRDVNPDTGAVLDWLDASAAQTAVGLRQDIGVRPASSLTVNRRVLVSSETGPIPMRGWQSWSAEPGVDEPVPTATPAA